MKKFILPFILAFLVFVACKKEASGDKTTGAVNSVEIKSANTDVQAGELVNGEYIVSNPDAVLKKWKERLDGLEHLKELEIIKGVAQETGEEYYLLRSKSKDSFLKVACLLIRKKDKFYFDTKSGGYQFVVCKSTCKEGCDISIITLDNEKILTCSECPDCVKSGTQVR